MAAKNDWYLDKRIIYSVLEGDLSIDDVIQINDEILELLKHGNERVYLVTDTTKVGRFPVNLTQLSKAIEYLKEPNLKAVVTIGTNNLLTRFVASTMTQVWHIELKMVNSMDEALAYLFKLDPTLQDKTA